MYTAQILICKCQMQMNNFYEYYRMQGHYNKDTTLKNSLPLTTCGPAEGCLRASAPLVLACAMAWGDLAQLTKTGRMKSLSS